MVAWMKSWDARVMTKGQKWQGMMTLPRELKIKDGKIWQSPVRELEKYKKNPIIYTEQKISGQMSLDGINGRVIDMTVELTNVEGREFKVDVHIMKNIQQHLHIIRKNIRLKLTGPTVV